MKKKVAVAIPIYSSEFTNNERISLEQCVKVLGNYDLYFIMPNSLNLQVCFPEILEKRFADEHFTSVKAYSKLMLDVELYKAFIDYEYLLIYQLDAFVFSDRLLEFCDKKWDYVGAPWVYGTHNGEGSYYVGNGGFSLRRVDAFIRWLKEDMERLDFLREYIPEDAVIATWGYGKLVIPNKEDAVDFSFEMNYDACMELNKGKLPFGCHAWEMYEPEKWKQWIEPCGYTVGDIEDSKRKSVDYERLRKINAIWSRFSFRTYFDQNNLMSCLKDGVIVYGLGRQGVEVCQMLWKEGIKIVMGIDNFMPGEWREKWPITIGLDSDLEDNRGIPVIVSPQSYSGIEEGLRAKGYVNGIDYFVYEEIIDYFIDLLDY